MTNDQQRALVQASYRHRYGVFIRLDLCTGLRMGELLALKWEDIDFSAAQLHVRRTINRLAKYEAHDGENKTEIVFGTPKTKNSRIRMGINFKGVRIRENNSKNEKEIPRSKREIHKSLVPYCKKEIEW